MLNNYSVDILKMVKLKKTLSLRWDSNPQ